MYLPRESISHLYNHLLRSHHPLSPPVLILPALEIDALCACRILTALLKRDFIPHKIQPVSGYADLAKVGRDLIRPMRTSEGGSGGVIICLGVGGLVDLTSLLGLENEDEIEDDFGGVELWVLDARRPWNLTNVFGGYQRTSVHADNQPATLRRVSGVERGCIGKSYRPGHGGIIVFDDGDIVNDLQTERDAYCTLVEMPDLEDAEDESEGEEGNEDDIDDQRRSGSKKRKSWSDRENEEQSSEDDSQRPRQRRRSNSGSAISGSREATPSSTYSESPDTVPQPKQLPAKQLRKKLLSLKRQHESVLDRYYSLGTSYSEPISSLAYSLASELGRVDNDLLWLAIVGVTSLELSGHTSTGLGTLNSSSWSPPNQYHQSWRSSRSSKVYALLREEVHRLNLPSQDRSSSSPIGSTSSPSDTSIRLTPDPRFMLFRHWSLYDSMLHSPYLAARLHVWNEAGVKRLHKLLAKMGISLTQCKQGYVHMDMDLRKSLRDRLLRYAKVYGLDDLVPTGEGRNTYNQDGWEGWGFIRSWGWKAQLSAVDVGVILSAILETGTTAPNATSTYSTPLSSQITNSEADVEDRSEALVPRFFAAYDALAPNNPTRLLASIPQAQHLLRAILRTGSSLLAKHQIRHLRAFRMGVVKDGPDLAMFANSPGALVKLALWIGEAVAVSEKDKKGTDIATPLVIGALDEPRGTYLVVGVGGGIGSGEDTEARRTSEAQIEKKAERERKKKIKEEKRAAKQAAKASRRKQDDNAEEDEYDEDDEEESEDSADDDDDEDQDEEETAESMEQARKRGRGRNRFGIAFQEVVEETNARVKIDSFDHCVVEVKKEDLAGFLEGLSLKSVIGK